ncbi:hypothetical protein BOX15_Mlig021133g2, partial [Macrostomum lignano]
SAATAETACYVHCSLRQPGQPDLTSRPEPLSATDSASCQVQSGGVDGESRWLLTLTGLPRRRVPSVKACRRASRRCDSVIVSGFTRPRRPEADDNDDGLSVDDEVGSTIAVSLAAVAKSLGLPDSAAEDVAANKPTVFVTNVWAYAVLRLRQPSQRLLLIGLRRDRRCRVLVNGKRRSQRSVLYYDWAGGQDDNDGFQPPRLTFSENWPPLVDYPAGESALLLAEPPDSLIRQLMLGDAVATADRLCALNGWSSRGCLVPLVSLEAALRQRQLDTVAFFLNSHEQAPLASLRPALDLMLSYLASLADSPAGRQYADQLAARINRFLCRQLLLADQADSSQAELSLYLSRVRRYCRRPVPQPPPTPLLKASSASLISSSASVGDASSASTSAAAAAASAWSQLADTDVLVDACLSNCVTRALEYFSNSSASRSCTAAHCLTVCRSRVRYLVGRRQLVEARVLLDASGADTERELRDLLLDCADAGLRSWLYLQLAADLPAEVQAAMSSMERLSSAYNTDEARAELRAALLAGEPEAAASESASPLTLRRMLSLAESRVQELLLRRSLAVQSLTDVLDRFPAQAVWRHLLAAGNYRLLSEALDAARPSSDDLDGLHSLPEWLSEPLLCRAAKSGRFSAKEASSRRLWLRRCALAGCLATEAEPLRALLGEALEAGHVTAASYALDMLEEMGAGEISDDSSSSRQSSLLSRLRDLRSKRLDANEDQDPESDWPAPEPLREDPSGVSLDSLLPACLAPVEAADKSAGGDAEPPEIGRLPHRYYLANLRPVSAYAVYLAEFFSAASPAASATASPLPLNRRSIRAAVTSVSAEAAAVAGASNSAIDAVTSALVFGHLCGVSDIQCKLRASDIVLAKSVSDAAAAEDPPADLGQLVMQWRCRALAAHLTGRPLPAEPLVQLAANDDWAGFLAAGQLLGYGKPRLLSLLNQFASRPVADHLAHVIEMASSTAPETTRPAEPRQRLYDQLGLTARPRSQQQQQQQSSSTTATVSAQQRRPPKHRRRGRSSSRNVASTLTTTESESSAETAAAVPPSRTPPPPNSDADEASTAPDESEIVGGRATAPEAPPRPPGDSDVDGGLLAVVGADSSRRHLGLYARQLGHPLLSLLSERPALSDYLASLAQLPPPTVGGDSSTGVDALLSTPDALIAECRSAGRLDALADACAVFLPQRRGLSELAAACHGISTSVGAEAPAVNERLLESLRAYRDDCPLTGALLRLWDELNAESRTSATATDADDSGEGEEVIGQFKLSARWTSLVGRLKAEEAASNGDADENLTGEGQQLGGPAAATAAPDAGASGLVSSRQRRSVVTLASPQPVTSPSPGGGGGSLESEVTELIDRHAAAASFQQLASVMSSARELTDRLEAAGQFAEMVRLARGIGRYGEMAYVFHKLRSAGHFEPELLCGRGGGVGGRDHRLQRALLEFLRRHCPEDRDSLIAVYLYYCMDRELGNLLFRDAQYLDAAQAYIRADCPRLAWRSFRLAQLAALPAGLRGAADPRRALAGHPNVYEAAVLAHAEAVRPAGRDWAAAVYGHVIGATATAAGAAAYQSGFMAHVLPTCDTWTGGWRDFEDRLRASCRSSEEKRAAEAFLAACQRSMPAA